MATLWLTYAWVDNEDLQVDFIVQELKATGLDVKYDRIHIVPGRRLWPQIDAGIAACDAWAIVVSKKSLESEPCREELAYALDRALSAREDQFPIIGIFVEQLERALIPSAIRTRLYTNIRDPAWKEIVQAGAERRPPAPPSTSIEPFIIDVHVRAEKVVFECRPRAGRWMPGGVGVPPAEKERLGHVWIAPYGHPTGPVVTVSSEAESAAGPFAWKICHEEVTPYRSLYALLHKAPTQLVFGGPKQNWRASEGLITRIHQAFESLKPVG